MTLSTRNKQKPSQSLSTNTVSNIKTSENIYNPFSGLHFQNKDKKELIYNSEKSLEAQ